MIDLASEFAAANAAGEYLMFERITAPAHPLRDICAFLMLARLAPMTSHKTMLACAGHDEVYLSTNLTLLAENATPQDIIDLHRCGVRYGSEGLQMFV